MVSDSPPSSGENHIKKASPKDKPLPSPPVAQIGTSISSVESKSLIDASDKPLRRSSTVLRDHEEDWPVLQPRRSASPGTLQEMMRETGVQLSQQAVPNQKERYPVLGNTLRQVPDKQLPVSRYSATSKAGQKDLSSQDPAVKLGEKKATNLKRASVDDDPFREGVYNTDLTSPAKPIATSTDLSASAIPAGKSTQESKPTIEPRQTRTSSLRARLSAGQLVNNGQSRVVGFTDFTAPNEAPAGTGRKDSLRARKEAQARRSITPPVAPSLHTKTSRDSIGANRAPAQFVAGSRRPAHPRRPSSRGSLRNENQGPFPPLSSIPPTRTAPTRPESREGTTKAAKDTVQPHTDLNTKQRMSSIPVSRKNLSTVTSQRYEKATSSESQSVEPTKVTTKREARDEFGIYNDHPSQDFMNDLATPAPRSTASRPAPFLIDNKDAQMLEAIEESPQRAYQLKRLSTQSPEYGPTLKISPAAERFIMGPDLSKENRPLNKKSSKDLDHAMIQDDLKNRKSSKTPPTSAKEHPERPSSSQGLSRLGSRVGLIDRKAREKKVKSADLSFMSPKIPERNSERATQRPHSQDVDASAAASKGSVSTTTDPFFDAPEELPDGSGKDTADHTSINQQGMDCEDTWIPPLVGKAKEHHATYDLPPVALQKGFGDDFDVDSAQSVEPNLVQTENNASQEFAQPIEAGKKRSPTDILFSTPQQSNGKSSTLSQSHPPRSSSRTAPPDWSSNKKSPSPPTAMRVPPPTPPKDSNGHQHSSGFLQGHASSQLGSKTPRGAYDDWLESTPRESYKSQASMSKGNSVLSNLRGLFHKRTPEHEPIKTVKGKTRSKVTIKNNGSPFPLLSEIHPVYRPTLASTNRSKATTPRTSATQAPTPATPSYTSPAPTEASVTTSMAMQILDSARHERSSPKKERLLELGKIMVEGITQARNAEKAMEEAKHAARQAEVAHALCRKSLADVGRCVQEWRENGTLKGKL